jgi:Isopenicillin N synthase and related dioxygenases
VLPIEGSLICNIGDLLERWTNGRLKSTTHRVLNTSGKERLSIPVFFDPNSDAWIDPQDFQTLRTKRVLPPVKAGEYITGKNHQNFLHYKN